MIEDDQLHEGPGFLGRFPLGGAFAGAQADDGTADADALAGFERDVADEAIAFVEQAEDGDPLRHFCDPGIGVFLTRSDRRSLGNRADVGGGRRRGFALAIAAGQRERSQSGGSEGERAARHQAASGVHA